MSRHPLMDGYKALASLAIGFVLPWVLLGVIVLGGFSLGRCSGTGKPSLQVAALRDTVRLTDSVYVVRTESVTVRQRRVDTVRAVSDSLDRAVVIVNDSTVSLTQDDSAKSYTIPPLVIADLSALRLTVTAQDSLIASLYQRDTTQQWRIASRDKLYTASLDKANGPRWGLGATLGYGCSPRGCGPSLSVGLTYQAKIPSPKQLLNALVR